MLEPDGSFYDVTSLLFSSFLFSSLPFSPLLSLFQKKINSPSLSPPGDFLSLLLAPKQVCLMYWSIYSCSQYTCLCPSQSCLSPSKALASHKPKPPPKPWPPISPSHLPTSLERPSIFQHLGLYTTNLLPLLGPIFSGLSLDRCPRHLSLNRVLHRSSIAFQFRDLITPVPDWCSVTSLEGSLWTSQ